MMRFAVLLAEGLVLAVDHAAGDRDRAEEGERQARAEKARQPAAQRRDDGFPAGQAGGLERGGGEKKGDAPPGARDRSARPRRSGGSFSRGRRPPNPRPSTPKPY